VPPPLTAWEEKAEFAQLHNQPMTALEPVAADCTQAPWTGGDARKALNWQLQTNPYPERLAE
jgi:hypothetical protein